MFLSDTYIFLHLRQVSKLLGIGLLAIGLLCRCSPNEPNPNPEPEIEPFIPTTSYEIPRLIEDRPEQVIYHLGYTVSYNHDWLLPNWVAYELTSEETSGEVEREYSFKPDPKLEGDFVTTDDYKNSGYDRGHMAPAADMKWSEQAKRECYYMTNICPQDSYLNRYKWKDLEEQIRKWAKQFGSVYIACGPMVLDEPEVIGVNHEIAVPYAFYKVLLTQTSQKHWSAIGFIMPNEAEKKKSLDSYAMSVDDVERLTGLDFFYTFPDSIEEWVEKHYSRIFWFP